MIIIPTNANPNSVHVGMVRTGCLKREFSTAYPARLNGIISQGEFRESIDNINSKISSTCAQLFCIMILILSFVTGIIFFIASGSISSSSSRSLYMIFIGLGIGLITFGIVFFSLGFCFVRLRSMKKMRQAIAEEAKKYWSRSTGRCNWRLSATRMWTGGYGRYGRRVHSYLIIIDIIQNTVAPRANAGLFPQSASPSTNARLYPQPVTPNANARLNPQPVTPRPTPSAPPPDDMPPPPYPGEPVQFCSQCGLLRPDLNAKFCVSCGHAYNT